MGFRSKQAENGISRVQKLPMPHGSFLMMSLETNRAWYHSIRQQALEGDDGPRISLTFRHIGSFYEPGSGAVWGVGAPTSDASEARERARARVALPPEERAQRARQEAEEMLRLFREENVNPGFAASSYRPGFEVLNFATLRAED